MNDLLDNRYQLDTAIVQDISGSFYAARDTRLNRDVTIKLIQTAENKQPTLHQRFVREARILGGLSEEALVQIYDVQIRPPRPYIVMESLCGHSLEDLLARDESIPLDEIQCWITTLANALSATHTLGFVHASVRPNTLFVVGQKPKRTIKLLGFRALRALNSLVSIEELLNAQSAAPYLAPELLDQGQADPRADIYALGAVAYRLLTGRPPEPNRTEFKSDFPSTGDFFTHVLAKDPTTRIQSMPHFLRKWQQLDDDLSSKELVSPPLGTIIGHNYKIQSRLGESDFGSVLLAHDERLDRHVAIKLLHELDDEGQRRFFAEARALAKIDHPNVVRIYALGEHERVPYIIMEHIAGTTVQQLLKKNSPLPLPDALSILQQTAQGLDAIHTAGLIHADVKPDNVLIGPAFRVCVTDFGLATISREWKPNSSAGTPAYMAPERILGSVKPELAHRVDVYALGIMAFELLTGKHPFRSSSPKLIMRAHLHTSPPSPSEVCPSVPRFFDPVILSALQKEPQKRVPSCDAFRSALDDAARQVRNESTQKHRVLIVDDDAHSRERFVSYFKSDFPLVHVDQVQNANEAFQALEQKAYQLVLMDLELPDMNAMEIAAIVRADFIPPPPLVVFTATGGAADWQILSSLGVRAFLLKPIHRDSLSVTVRRFLE